jgi:pyruvate formate lyase activating enzyme
MQINGFEGVSLVDYPGKVCSIIYTSPCNFKCGFCHNPLLIPVNNDVMDPDAILADLAERAGFIEGVTITGGEPTLQLDLPEFAAALKSMNFLVKLDTNGYRPQALRELMDKKLLDYIAMDIKAAPDKYSAACGTKIDLGRIRESINTIMNSGVDYEFRTTVAPGFVEPDDAYKIGEMIKGAKSFSVQQFDNKTTYDTAMKSTTPYTENVIAKFAEKMREFVKEVRVLNTLSV